PRSTLFPYTTLFRSFDESLGGDWAGGPRWVGGDVEDLVAEERPDRQLSVIDRQRDDAGLYIAGADQLDRCRGVLPHNLYPEFGVAGEYRGDQIGADVV